MRRHIPPEIKNSALELRKRGGSIGIIAKSLGISKSTAYEWTKDMEGAERFAEIGRKRWIDEIQPLGAIGQRKKRENKIALIKSDTAEQLKNFKSSPELEKSVLSVLYWAEGSKGRGMLKFANTDPKLMKLFITLLRRSYLLDETKFRVGLHLHWYHKERDVKKFWSELLGIPITQFHKTYHKKRSKEKVFRKNIGGICFLIYNSDDLREKVAHYSYALGDKLIGRP